MSLEHSSSKKIRTELECHDDENSRSSPGSVHAVADGHSVLQSRDSVELPNNLSNWERKHLENLNFRFLFGFTPIELITKGQIDLTEITENNQLQMKLNLIEKSGFTDFLNKLEFTYSSFDNFRIDNPDRVIEWARYLHDNFSFGPLQVEVPKVLKLWFASFHSFAKEFTHRLYNILLRKERNLPVDDSHYQFLFTSFVSAFGMICGTSFAPCVDNQTFMIGDCEVVGTPDIVFSCITRSSPQALEPRKGGDTVVAVCEVKKNSLQLEEKSCSPTSNKTRSRTKRPLESEVTSTHGATGSASNPDINSQMHNFKISDKLIGKHGGDLLFNFQKSLKQNTVMGMIVQQTQVTFTSLEMSGKTFEGVVNGEWKRKQECEPVMTITRPYDIFKAEDRKQLIESFIKFADFQRIYLE